MSTAYETKERMELRLAETPPLSPAKRVREFLTKNRRKLYAILTVLLLWQLLSYIYPDYLFPPLQSIADDTIKIFASGKQLEHYGSTVYRIVLALAGAFLTGLFLSVVMSFNRLLEDYFLTIFHVMMGVPALSWVVFAVIWFKFVEFRIFFVVFVGALPMFTLHLHDSIKGIDREKVDMLRVFRPTRWQMLRMLILPALLPVMLTSWKINIGYGTRVVIVAELVGATTGVGYQLLMAQELFKMSSAIAWTLTLVLFLVATEQVLLRMEGVFLRYRPAMRPM